MIPSLSVRQSKVTGTDFRKEITTAIDALPTRVASRLEHQGVTVRTGRRVVDIFPDLKGVVPRGAASGVTWEHVAAGYDVKSKIVVVGEQVAVPGVDGLLVVAGNPGGVLLHELGHAWDDLGFDSGAVRDRQELMDAWQQDIARIESRFSRDQQNLLGYYLDGDDEDALRQEIVAEGFAVLTGIGSDPDLTPLVRRGFPATLAIIRSAINESKEP